MQSRRDDETRPLRRKPTSTRLSTQNTDVTPPGLGPMTQEGPESELTVLGATNDAGNAGIDLFCSVAGRVCPYRRLVCGALGAAPAPATHRSPRASNISLSLAQILHLSNLPST